MIAFGVLSSIGVSLFKEEMFVPMLLVLGIFTFLLFAFFLVSLKRITVLCDGLEAQSVLLPFRKRFYRFAEFDYSEKSHTSTGEVLRLVKDGRRVISISSAIYKNYMQLCQAIDVQTKERFCGRDNAEVVSEYNKVHLYGGLGFGSFSVAVMALMSVGPYCDGKVVSLGMFLFSTFGTLFFGGLMLTYLFSYQNITVWRGQVEVRRLLWPFRVKYYLLDDFDGCYDVIIKSDGQMGSKDEELRWLVKNEKVVLEIGEREYRNFEALRNATRIQLLGRLELSYIQAMKYSLGKTIQL
ncbi:hypothetical protein L6466_05490 [Prevotella communis]|uniref:hypothetical protein n=1 Tax=Prevotella communis TaxID=2913614 RepID=UPI001ED9F954|nr:hypothetical protein [Prevotella communis]UKK71481.1 hypothetical protein L6466_05490 [Prevotella communis]